MKPIRLLLKLKWSILGAISDKEFKERMGISPPDELKTRRDGSNKAAEDYIIGLLEKIK